MNFRKALDWRKALIYTHRWLGIALSAVFVIWFVSGAIFMYVGMPTLPAEERLLRMEPLDVSTIAVSPAEAASTADLGHRLACVLPCMAVVRCTDSCRAARGRRSSRTPVHR